MRLSKASHLTLSLWLPLALAATLITGFSYWAVQQNYRLAANDPQSQIAHDAVLDLATVPDLGQLAGAFNKQDISKIYNSFLIIYDDQKKPVAGNGYLNDQLASVPSGVFSEAIKKGEADFTWQPRKDLRFAAVLKPFSGQKNGYILAAKSLADTEKRIKLLTIGAAAAWALALIASYIWSMILAKWMVKHFAAHDHTHT